LIAVQLLLAIVATTPESVPNPRSQGRWIADVANVIPDEAEVGLEAKLTSLERDLGVELAVVTVVDVDSTPKDFATRLFERWGIGKREANNGLLVLMVMGQRRLEMETGYGLEGILPDGWLGSMQAEVMVPQFKQGYFDRGLIVGLEAIDRRLREHADEARRGSPLAAGPAKLVANSSYSAPLFALPLPLLIGIGLAITLLFATGLWWVMKPITRRCKPCNEQMLQLDELADDKHLDKGQRAEERIGSVNYLVFICGGCQTTTTVRRGKWFSGYSQCNACSYKTLKSNSRTITYATYDHGGLVEISEQCHHCSHGHTYTRSTPRRTRPTTTSSSSSSSWSSGSSSSSSFGGGSSGGGGAGSSW
jgi:uncharacterized protein